VGGRQDGGRGVPWRITQIGGRSTRSPGGKVSAEVGIDVGGIVPLIVLKSRSFLNSGRSIMVAYGVLVWSWLGNRLFQCPLVYLRCYIQRE